MFNFIKDILGPKKCYSCKKEGHFLCNFCSNKVNNYLPSCYICKKYSKNFLTHKNCKNTNIHYDKIIILSHYKNKIMSKLIKDAKFYNKKDIFKEIGIRLGGLLLKNIFLDKEKYIVLPVPMSLFRKIKRGYNHSEILAKAVSKNTEIYYNKNIITRNKYTRQQSKLNKINRQKNLENAFKINKTLIDKIDNKIVILVDDVISTGSTVNEISKLLKDNGVKKAVALVVASD